jgi:hypothetical protein
MMIAEYLKQMYHRDNVQDIWFWRDAAGHEVDLLVQDGLSLQLVEIKATQTIMPELFKGLLYYEKESKQESLTKTLVYAGNDSQQRSAGDVMPWFNFGTNL